MAYNTDRNTQQESVSSSTVPIVGADREVYIDTFTTRVLPAFEGMPKNQVVSWLDSLGDILPLAIQHPNETACFTYTQSTGLTWSGKLAKMVSNLAGNIGARSGT